MRVLVLDFDGVLCDSAREAFTTAVRTYAELIPDSPLAASVLGFARSPTGLDLSQHPSCAGFCRLMPLGNRAEDFGVALLALDHGVELPDQDAYDAFYDSLDARWLADFHRRFYEVREQLRDADPDGWLSLHGGYPQLNEVLQRRHRDARLAIATAKDATSLDLLLRHLGVADLFSQELRLDKETGVQKTDHLRAVAERLAAGSEAITFVDDKVNHLERVALLGVRPVLAAWGHNSSREHRRAIELGFEVADLATAERILFGS